MSLVIFVLESDCFPRDARFDNECLTLWDAPCQFTVRGTQLERVLKAALAGSACRSDALERDGRVYATRVHRAAKG